MGLHGAGCVANLSAASAFRIGATHPGSAAYGGVCIFQWGGIVGHDSLDGAFEIKKHLKLLESSKFLIQHLL